MKWNISKFDDCQIIKACPTGGVPPWGLGGKKMEAKKNEKIK